MPSDRRLFPTALFGLATLLAACDASEPLTSPEPPDDLPAFALGSAVPASARGEEFRVCKHGSSATFQVSEVTDFGVALINGDGVFSLADGECVVAATHDSRRGHTAEVQVQEISTESGFVLDHIEKTQITCARGRGTECTTGPFPIVTQDLDAADPVSGFVGGSGLVNNRSEKGLSGVLVEYFNVPETPPSETVRGEEFKVCKLGSAGTFRITELTSLGVALINGDGVFSLADGECVVAATHDSRGGHTAELQVQEISTQSGFVLGHIEKTQLTCGLGLGDECTTGPFPIITEDLDAADPVSGFVGGTGPAGNRSEKGLSGVLVEYFNVPATPPSETVRGEQFKVCKFGSAGTFRITELTSLGVALINGDGVFSLADGECIVAATHDSRGGHTAELQVQEISTQSGFVLGHIEKTQLTCGRGLGDECTTGPFPIVTEDLDASDPVSGFVGGSGLAGNRSEKGLSGVLVEYFNVPGGSNSH